MKHFYGSLIICCSAVFGVLLALSAQVRMEEILRTLFAAETLFALRLSLLTSVSAVAIALFLGVPAAYILARKQFPGKFIVDTFLDIPLVMTPLVIGMGLLFLFGPELAGGALERIGVNLLFSPGGAVVAQAFIATPLMIRSCRNTFEEIDIQFDRVASTLGLRDAEIFFLILLPMARNGILSGTVLAWTRTLGEFGATLMVAGATRFRTEMLPITVYLNLTRGELSIAVTCAWILIAIGFLLLLLLKWLGYYQKTALF